MRAISKLIISMIVLNTSMSMPSEFFNLTLTMPNMKKTMSNQSAYVSMKLSEENDLYIVDFHPIYNRQEVHFITTYLCEEPFSIKENVWFDSQPCYNMETSIIIYEWYYSVPAIRWPNEAGFHIGMNTPYRYIVIQIQYFSVTNNNIYGQAITFTRKKPKYRIGSYQIITNSIDIQKNRADFSCRHRSSPMKIFSTQLYSKYEGQSVSLYRVRYRKLQSIIKGNLQWPQTFYEVEDSNDIIANDYLIGTCKYQEVDSTFRINSDSDVICQMNLMFWMEQDDEMPIKQCWNNYYSSVLNRYLPIDELSTPQTLFDINPTYPKLTPNEWILLNVNETITSWTSIETDNNTLFLTYSQNDRFKELVHLARSRQSVLKIIVIILAALCSFALFILIVGIIRLCTHRIYLLRDNTRSRAISVGGETSSLSKWLTKRRFQEYDQETSENGEKDLLNNGFNRPTSTEESEVSDNELFNTTDFRNVILKNQI